MNERKKRIAEMGHEAYRVSSDMLVVALGYAEEADELSALYDTGIKYRTELQHQIDVLMVALNKQNMKVFELSKELGEAKDRIKALDHTRMIAPVELTEEQAKEVSYLGLNVHYIYKTLNSLRESIRQALG